MPSKLRHQPGGLVRAWLALAALPLLAACGGGAVDTDEGTAGALNRDVPEDRAQALSAGTPALGTLLLASSTSTGQARSGNTCGVSADGSQVLFTSTGNLIGTNSNFLTDLYVKNVRTGAISRANTFPNGGRVGVGNPATCLGMTPDARFVAFSVVLPGGGVFDFPPTPTEPVIYVKDVSTGALVRATPALASVPTTANWQFAGLSQDGKRLAFIALPTSTYQGGYVTLANGPARLMVSDLSNPAAVRTINLEAQAPLSLNQASVFGDALLSPDGSQVAFSTQANVTAAGDTNGIFDTFMVQVDTGELRRINTDGSGNTVVGGSSTNLFGTLLGLQAFINQGRSLVVSLSGNTNVGPAGLYAKRLDTGALRLLMATAGLPINTSFLKPDITVSDAGTSAVYVRRTGNSQTGQNVPTLRNLLTGQETRVDITPTGVVSNGLTTTAALISADGTTVAFSNDGRNLVGSNRNRELRAYTKTVAAAPAAAAQ